MWDWSIAQQVTNLLLGQHLDNSFFMAIWIFLRKFRHSCCTVPVLLVVAVWHKQACCANCTFFSVSSSAIHDSWFKERCVLWPKDMGALGLRQEDLDSASHSGQDGILPWILFLPLQTNTLYVTPGWTGSPAASLISLFKWLEVSVMCRFILETS